MKTQRIVTYCIVYRWPSDFDEDSPSGIGDHVLSWHTSTDELQVKTDRAAKLASLDKKYWPYESYHRAYGFPIEIVKTIVERTEDGFERITKKKVSLPTNKSCPCGKLYWPVKGETACHELRPKNKNRKRGS